MIHHKLQVLEEAIIKQQGQKRLILNDLILNIQAIEMLATLIPKYHPQIEHIEIKGNNIDSTGFQIIFTALQRCSKLMSIQAEWNNIGGSDQTNGIQALLYLTKTLRNLEFIDLKNNRITHTMSNILCELIESDHPKLKALDLRWNDLGEIGGRNILNSLAHNRNMRFIGLDDNRISFGTLSQIQNMLKQSQLSNQPQHQKSVKDFAEQFYPLSGTDYNSMGSQLKNVQIRKKIDNEQKESDIYIQRVQTQIDKSLSNIKYKGAQINELRTKLEGLTLENQYLLSNLRDSEGHLVSVKQKMFMMERKLGDEKKRVSGSKYQINTDIQIAMQKITHRNQRELEQLDKVMGDKYEMLSKYLKQRLLDKRSNREKLIQIKQDIMKIKVNKEDCWNKQTTTIGLLIKSNREEQCFALEEMINDAQGTINGEIKKGNHLSTELNNLIQKALRTIDKLESNIFEHQKKIKNIHNEIALHNLRIESSIVKLKGKQSNQMDFQSAMNTLRQYMKFIEHLQTINIQIEHMKHEELQKVSGIQDDNIYYRIQDLQKGLKSQEAQNKIIRNQYEKLVVLIENNAKKAIHSVLFE